VPRCEESNERMVKNPIKASMIPRISNFRSFEILFHCQVDLDDFRRVLRVVVLGREMGLDDLVEVFEEFVLE